MTPFESLIAELAETTGLPLQTDAHDACTLETDGILLTLQHRRERGDVVLFAPVTEPDVDLPPETLRRALALACHGEGTRGAFLGIFEDTLLLSAVLPLEGLDTETLAARLLAFADSAADVRAALAAPAHLDAATESVPAGVHSCVLPPDSGFMV